MTTFRTQDAAGVIYAERDTWAEATRVRKMLESKYAKRFAVVAVKS